jgi:2-oxoisovalerate dehydrogenase E1 component
MPIQIFTPDLYRALYRIRRFDETVLENFSTGVFFGTTHTYLGQEADAVGVLAHLQAEDVVFSNHRCHGHFLAYGGDLHALFAELMGRATGVCGGRGGSQHLQWRNFYSNGVQGGIVPVATGMALAEARKNSQAVTVVFIGDGTLGEGAVYESLNLASLWRAPILFVVENNRIAQTTPVDQAVAGNIAARFAAFGILVEELDSSDVLEILPLAGRLLDEVRRESTPRALVLHTCRFGPHSKSDDTRLAGEIALLRQQRDPLTIHGARLDAAERAAIEAEVETAVQQAYQQALGDPFPALSVEYTISSEQPAVSSQRPGIGSTLYGVRSTAYSGQPTTHSVLDALNHGLHQALTDDPNVLVLGEDILDPYGGAFKVTRGLSSAFPGRVLTTPISEAGLTGAATGMALRGLRPVVEIMFGDFVTLIADQVINHAAKFRWMYNGGKQPLEQIKVPMVIRTPMGGRRGYGPTHSQTLEKHFLGVPGLYVVAPSSLVDPGALLYETILTAEDPVLFIENKLLYLLPVHTSESLAEFDISPVMNSSRGMNPRTMVTLQLRGAPPPNLTLAAYGYMAELARQAMLRLAYEHEIFAELVVPTQLAPFALDPLLESADCTRRLVTVEEGGLSLGWGAEVLAQTAQALGGRLQAAHRLAALDLPVPSSGPLEAAVLPGVDEIVKTCLRFFPKG